MPIQSVPTSVRALDGLNLAATLVTPDQKADSGIVLVHGGGVTREEGGFFTRLAEGLAGAGVASLRFDLRGHGESQGTKPEATLAAHCNDISVNLAALREHAGVDTISLLGTSFGGGLAAYYAANSSDELHRLVLLNPQLNYKNRYIDQKPQRWQNDRLTDEAARALAEHGFLEHSATVRHGRAFLHEVFWMRPNRDLGKITAPTLLVHGTEDTFVPVETSRQAVEALRVPHKLVEIPGAQHGFAVHDDPQYLHPQSQQWQAFVIDTVATWLLSRTS